MKFQKGDIFSHENTRVIGLVCSTPNKNKTPVFWIDVHYVYDDIQNYSDAFINRFILVTDIFRGEI